MSQALASEGGRGRLGPADEHGAAQTAYRRAWWSLAFFPVSFVLAFVVGEGLFDLLPGGGEDPSVWTMVVAGGSGMVLFALPGIAAVILGRRAMRLGRREGRVPAGIGAAVAIGFIALNLFGGLMRLIAG